MNEVLRSALSLFSAPFFAASSSLLISMRSIDVLVDLFSWIPFSDAVLSPRLLESSFSLLRAHHLESSSRACACLAEILERRFMPQTEHCISFQLRLADNLVMLIEEICGTDVSSLDDAYDSLSSVPLPLEWVIGDCIVSWCCARAL